MAIRFLNDQSIAGVLSVVKSTSLPLLNIFNSSNGSGSTIKFSDISNLTQNGTITYVHTDTQSYGSGNAFILTGDQTSMTILADGKLMYKEGIYSKPATGTGAGTRKDSNWDSAYNNKVTAISDSGTSTTTITLTQQDGGTLSTSFSNPQGTITSSGSITGYSGSLIRTDNRTIAPNEYTAGRLNFGFTSWGNNNSSPYADFLHMSSYTDSSGGSPNLLMLKKSGIGMRIWQQSWNSSNAYANYEDVYTTADPVVEGTGVTSQIAVWSSSTSIIDGPVSFSGNNANFAGNVGINEPSPDAKLHIKQANSGTVTTIITEDAARKLFIGRDSIKCTNLSDTATSLFIQQDGGLTQTGGDFKSLGDVTVTGDITVTGGDITLGGTGRIQGIDTVSASTDAANKAYVDANSSSLSGSGAGGRVTIWSGTNILSSDTQLLFDTSTNKLTSTLFQIPNNGDYLGTDTGGSARTLISLTSGNDVEVSNSALTTGSDTIIYFGDNFRVKDGSTNRLSISSNGTMSNFGNTFNSGPINLDEGNKIVFDVDGDNWNYIYANSGNTDMAVGGTLTLINIEENLFGDIKLENIYSIINGSTSSNATFIPVYTDSASSTVPRLLREQTPAQFLSNAGAITGAGASGRVAFFTGTRTQASDTLYWNSTQNALGINVNPTSSTAGHLQMPGTTNSGGKSIFINSTLSSTYGALGIDVKTPRYGSAIQLTSNQTSGSTVMKILRYTGTQVGSIVANNGSTSFNTSSDRRLKEKITKTLDGAGEVLDQLRPCRFTFVDPKDPFAFGPNVAGFIADELQEVVPDAVSGLAGEVDNNRESPNFGQPIYQQVDTTKLIPYLTQAIKDLQARVTSIEKRLPREPGPREFKEL